MTGKITDGSSLSGTGIDPLNDVMEIVDVSVGALDSANKKITRAALHYPRGARVHRTTNQSVSTNVDTLIQWSATAYDTDSCFSGGANTKLSVPTGWSWVRVAGGVTYGGSTGGFLAFKKTGSFMSAADGAPRFFDSATTAMVVHSPPLSVVGGTDYFEMDLFIAPGTNVSEGWFCLELIA
jgi:C1A family cysteine protease